MSWPCSTPWGLQNTSTTSSRVGHKVLSYPLLPSLPVKAIKLFLSTSCKTVSAFLFSTGEQRPDFSNRWLLFSHLMMPNSLQPHGLQHARLSCPSLSPGVCSAQTQVHWVDDMRQDIILQTGKWRMWRWAHLPSVTEWRRDGAGLK